MKTYNERLLEIAEEMVRVRYAEDGYFEEANMKYLIKLHKPLARIALKHMAEAYAEGCSTILLDKDEIQRNLVLIGYEPQTT